MFARLIFFLVGQIILFQVSAQNITNGEYFIDEDPGVGNATSVDISDGEVLNIEGLIPTDGIENGFHYICIRYKDEQGVWSHSNCRSFFKQDADPSIIYDVVSAEYFIDEDPGIGNGTAIDVATGDSLTLNDVIPTDGLENGFHYFCIRYRDAAGIWSHTNCRSFYKQTADPNIIYDIVGGEFFIGDDPGIGNGNPIELAQIGDSLEVNDFLDMDTLELGDYILTFRFLDSGGIWSHNNSIEFAKCEVNGPIADADWIVNGNTVSFINNSEWATNYSWDFGDGTTSSSSVPLHEYVPGVYEASMTASNVCGEDSWDETIEVIGVSSYSPNTGGQGLVTMFLDGYGYSSNTQIFLSREGNENIEPFSRSINELQTSVEVVFQLDSVSTGFWNINVIFDNGVEYVMNNGFEIAPADSEISLSTSITGSSAFRGSGTYHFSVSNQSNIDAFFVPIAIIFGDTTTSVEYSFDFTNIDSLETPENTGDFTYYENPFGSGNWYTAYNLIIPKIPATQDYNFSASLQIGALADVDLELKVGSPITGVNNEESIITSIINDLLDQFPEISSNLNEEGDGLNEIIFGESLTSEIDNCSVSTSSLIRRALDTQSNPSTIQATGLQGMWAAVVAMFMALKALEIILDDERTNPNNNDDDDENFSIQQENNNPNSAFPSFYEPVINERYVMSSASNQFDFGELNPSLSDFLDIALVSSLLEGQLIPSEISNQLEQINEFTVNSCPDLENTSEDFYDQDNSSMEIDLILSFDPNEKYTDQGVLGSNYVNEKSLTYAIYYENVDTAQAAAQFVYVTDSIDTSSLDLSSLKLKSFGVKDTIFYVTPDKSEYSQDFGLNHIDSMYTRINFYFDTLYNVLHTDFLSIDSVTEDLITDPFLGFLPPNIENPEGEGFFVFEVNMLPSVNSGDTIYNQASIVFDINEPILTSNTFVIADFDNPTSQVQTLDEFTLDTLANIEWLGEDTTSAVAFYTIYARDTSQGNWFTWKYQTLETNAVFEGEYGRTYEFVSMATDSAGNMEIVNFENSVFTTLWTEEINADIDLEQISCSGENDATIDLFVYGGTGNYTIEWEDGSDDLVRNNLAPGTYEISISDDLGNVFNESFEISEPDSISFTAEITQSITCFGFNDGQAQISPQGGTGDLSVIWLDSEPSSLNSGYHTFEIVDENNCVLVDSIFIQEPDSIFYTAETTDINCFGADNGTAMIEASGGTGDISLDWGESDPNNLGPGEHEFVLEDENGCEVIDLVTIEEPEEIQVEETINQITCNGEADGSIELSPSGGAGDLAIVWTNVEDPVDLGPGTYTYTIIDDNLCEVDGEVEIIEPDPIEITLEEIIEPSSADECDGSITISATGGTGELEAFWTSSETNGVTITDLCEGEYEVVVSDENGCEISDLFLLEATSTSDLVDHYGIEVFPNPTDAVLTINITDNSYHLQEIILFDSKGSKVFEKDFEQLSNEHQINFNEESLATGTYLLKMLVDENWVSVRVAYAD